MPSSAVCKSRKEALYGWGMYNFCVAEVYRPNTVEQLCAAIDECKRRGLSVWFRGSGCSYGDVALNQGGAVIDVSQFNKIISVDKVGGVAHVECGVTIEQVWKMVVPLGYWLPVVPGTMHPTLGGCVAMNIHGKNNWKVGPIGEHIEELRLLTPSGEFVTCSRSENADLFLKTVGGAGLFGCIVDLKMRLKKIHSGFLEMRSLSCGNLKECLETIDSLKESHHYVVGWLDCYARGDRLGRGIVHTANYLEEGHPLAGRGLRIEDQELPRWIFGIVPRKLIPKLVRPFASNRGMCLINRAKFFVDSYVVGKSYYQSHTGFNFLLDSVPNWKTVFLPGGLLQYQLFIPKKHAEEAFTRAIELQRELEVFSYLGVLKRHREDGFARSYSLNGFSLALDFAVNRRTATRLGTLCRRFDELIESYKGKVYLAKDSFGRIQVLRARLAQAATPAKT